MTTCPTERAQELAAGRNPRRRATRPRVSVVIPTYDRPASLRRLLARLAECDVPDGGMEVIVVDDGSADPIDVETAQASVRVITQRHAGGAAARETGRCMAQGDCLVFLDDDVVPERDAIVKLVHALDDHDGAGARLLPMSTASLVEAFAAAEGLVDHRIVDGRVVWLVDAAVAYRRTAVDAVGGYDTRFVRAGEDVDLTIRLAARGFQLCVVPDAVVLHQHRSSVRALFRSYYERGGAQRLLVQRHPEAARRARSVARAHLGPGAWIDRYRAYRKAEPRRRAVQFLALRLVGSVIFAVGALRGEAPPAAGDRGVAARRPGHPR